jgi:MinD superfamily P-loop ATPase
VDAGVIVNKADLNTDLTQKICAAARQAGAAVLGTLPYDDTFTRSQIRRKTLLEDSDNATGRALKSIWELIRAYISR